MPEAFKEFGKDLRKAREAKGLTRAALTEMVNIVPQYITNVENYGRIPSLSVFHSLVRACEMPVEKYFFPERTQPLDMKKKRIIEKICLCPEEYLPVVDSMVESLVHLKRDFFKKRRFLFRKIKRDDHHGQGDTAPKR